MERGEKHGEGGVISDIFLTKMTWLRKDDSSFILVWDYPNSERINLMRCVFAFFNTTVHVKPLFQIL